MSFDFNSNVENQEAFYSKYTLPPQVRGGVAIDLGCNVGLFSLDNYKNFSHIYAIDASYQNFMTTIEKITKLGIKNINCFNLAAAKKDKEVIKIYKNEGLHDHVKTLNPSIEAEEMDRLGIAEWHPVDSVSALTCAEMIDRLHPEGETARYLKENGMFHNVYTISLDGIYEFFDLNYIDYLKIDIEGAEYDFLLDSDLSRICAMGIEIHGTLGAEKKNKLKQHIGKYFEVYDIQYDNEAPGHSVITYINKTPA